MLQKPLWVRVFSAVSVKKHVEKINNYHKIPQMENKVTF